MNDLDPDLRRILVSTDAIQQRVKELAENIAGLMPTPYDQAIAIESWLRANIAYDEKLEAPPLGTEASDYILYETKRAYCTYYATAMVMMLRSLGVPARMAAGYAQGEQTPADGAAAHYSVKVKDAHAWVEVFFPRYGWIEFEPTAGQPPLNRAEGAAALLYPTPTPAPPTPTPQPTPNPNPVTPQPGPQPPAEPESPQQQANAALQNAVRSLAPLFNLLLAALAVGAMIGLAWLGLRIAEGAGFGNLPPVQRFYAMLSRWATWLGIGHAHTPFEQAELLAERAPQVKDPAQRITELYVEQRYSPRMPGSHEEMEARTAWRRARSALRQAWLTSRLRKLIGR